MNHKKVIKQHITYKNKTSKLILHESYIFLHLRPGRVNTSFEQVPGQAKEKLTKRPGT